MGRYLFIAKRLAFAIPLLFAIVLLVFLLAMNGFAIYLRNKFETRW